jgi:DNA helicase TIP49 (TBP-interacting protein)
MDVVSGARLNVPDERFPATDIVRFFLSRDDAEKLIAEVLPRSPKLNDAVLVAVPVPLIKTARAIAAARKAGQKVGFVVHSPNEVFETFGP